MFRTGSGREPTRHGPRHGSRAGAGSTAGGQTTPGPGAAGLPGTGDGTRPDTLSPPLRSCPNSEINCQEPDFEHLVLSHHNTEALRAARSKINRKRNKATVGL